MRRIASGIFLPYVRVMSSQVSRLQVNGKRKRLFFETEAEAEEELRNLQIKSRRKVRPV